MNTTQQDQLNVVTDTGALEQACVELAKGEFIVLDTEFHRESTFWPKLCLIQAATADYDVLIDPLSDDIDLTPFLNLIAEPGRMKVFHAARQDMEIFNRLMGTPPGPVFDSQIAAMACGLGDSISYENLVAQLLKARIDKSSQFTDWTRRPLSAKQLHYARGDVTHLREIYVILKEKLEKLDRMRWIEEETAILTDPATFDTAPENAWKRMKLRNSAKPYLALIAAVSQWREALAQELDKPRSRVLKDDAVQEIAVQKPRNEAAMDRLRAVPKGFSRSTNGRSLIQVINDALDDPDAYAPEYQRRSAPAHPPSGLPELLKVLLKQVSDEAGVVTRLIANAADVERIAAESEPDVAAMRGWRREVFGEKAIALKSGKLALAATPDGVKLIEL